jgi:RimJ/RimL family protein N-acetyltransferase
MITPLDLISSGPATLPAETRLAGARVKLVPLDADVHAATLYDALRGHEELWRYLPEEPPADAAAFKTSLLNKAGKSDPYFLAILDNQTGSPVGIAAYMRIEPRHRVIEVGNILFSPLLQRTPQATEAMYLMAKHAFEGLGYRRYEWKCNARNEASRKAALRFGFTFEGIFRQHMIVKGENRDTAWFSMLDTEWPARRNAFEQWLASENFNANGSQKRSLASFRE